MTDTAAWTEKRFIEIDAPTLCRWLASEQAVLVDVREECEFAEDRIPGAVNVPLSKFDVRKLPARDGRRLVLACAIGRRSAQAAGILLGSGYDTVIHLRGGMLAWDDAGYDTSDAAPLPAAAATTGAVLNCASA